MTNQSVKSTGKQDGKTAKRGQMMSRLRGVFYVGIGCAIWGAVYGVTPAFWPHIHAYANTQSGTQAGIISMQDNGKPMEIGEVGTVKSIVDGDTLYLDSGLKVRLSGMQAPKLSLGRDWVKDWPLGEASKSELERLCLGRKVQLVYSGERRDRYDRALAQVWLLDADDRPSVWLQEAMVGKGLARVYTWPDTFQDTDSLYKAERSARDSGLGMWGNSFYKVRSPNPDLLAQDVDSYQIIEGIVVKTADVRGTVYLNFGADYKTDFTVAIASKHRKTLEKSGLDLLSLDGAKLRVRGWIELKGGPIIWLDHAQRLEVLD